MADNKDAAGLMSAIHDHDATVRREAAWGLLQLKDPATVPVLVDALEDGDGHVRRLAVKALEAMHWQPVDITTRIRCLVINDKSYELSNVRDPDAVPALVDALANEYEYIRKAAADALGEIRSLAAVPALVKALDDVRDDVRCAATKAIGKIRDPTSVPILIDLLVYGDKPLSKLQEKVPAEAAIALGNIGGAAAVAALIKALNYSRYIGPHYGSYVAAIALGLGKTGAPEAIPALSSAFEYVDHYSRNTIVEALGEIGGPAAVPALIKVLRTGDKDIQRKATQLLDKIKDAAGIPDLVKALDDDSEFMDDDSEFMDDDSEFMDDDSESDK